MFSGKEDTTINVLSIFSFSKARQPLVGQVLLIIKTSRSYSDTSQSVGLLWTSDQPDAEVLFLTTISIYNRKASIPPVGFKPAIPASERPQTYALDRAAIAIGTDSSYRLIFSFYSWISTKNYRPRTWRKYIIREH